MKKVILTVAAIFAFGFASAQDKKGGSDSEMSFGAKGGLNMATVSNATGSSALIGAHIGGFAEFKLSDKFAVQPELLFSMQGAKFDSGSFSLNYINVPVMAKYYVADAFSVEAGPQIGFLMSAKDDGEDVKDGYNTIDFGVNFGAGYDLNEKMVLGLRYNLGLSDLQKDLPSGYDGSKNGVLSLSFGYKF
jgi:hypothetical protein